MENKTQPQNAETAVIEIKAINEDSYWTKEFDLPTDQQQKFDKSIYDLIADAHIQTKNSDN
ncbi:MAG TPA: hypothetical protein VHS53_14965 [Mucilaginibacter sp.]|jgi:hypothetical protein|nr:hypothetical protein [Mucilaginibacter sp.]HWD89143.1 hypothetical protein [Mucilaginibacter sp.]